MAVVTPTATEPDRQWRRVAVVLVVVTVASWAGWTALRQPTLPEFEASGAPIDLPAEGDLESVSLRRFEGMLVGQRSVAIGLPVAVVVVLLTLRQQANVDLIGP